MCIGVKRARPEVLQSQDRLRLCTPTLTSQPLPHERSHTIHPCPQRAEVGQGGRAEPSGPPREETSQQGMRRAPAAAPLGRCPPASWSQSSAVLPRCKCGIAAGSIPARWLQAPCRMAWHSLLLLPFLLAAASGNTVPIFNMTIVYVAEDLYIGETAFTLIAYDLDGDPITYSISGTDSFYFNVDSQTGVVTLKNLLDRETQAKLTIIVTVSDGINAAVSKRLTIIVEDRNDNAPVFQNLPYETSVLENTTVGSIIYNVFANDSDTGTAARVSYSIQEVIPDAAKNRWLFYILFNGSVVLNSSLDYTINTFLQLKILAQDGGGLLRNETVIQSSTTYLSITVIDVPNLNPRFLNEPYSGSVPEGCPVGTTVLTVTAMDRDTGVNDKIYYSFTNASVPFAINDTTGTITVSQLLDREQLLNEEVLLEVTARESNLDIYGNVAQASTVVTVLVTDINDNKPHFYQCLLSTCDFIYTQSNFTGSIVEHSPSNMPVSNLNIVARDPDKGINGTFELYLQGESASAFTVSPTRIVGTGEVQILVQDPSAVDYEITHVMVVQLIANDTGNPTDCCSTATVTIDLIDTNDHFPEFPQSTYSLSVMENSPDGTVVATNITAYDPDSGAGGQITYQLLQEYIQQIFMVNATSGAVLVRNGSFLDREKRSMYSTNLQAKDGGNKTSTTMLEITVLDENDNEPIIIGSYFIYVEEGQNVSTQIKAFDNDEEDTPNSELGFKIVPGLYSNNFTINQISGEMHSIEPLDREAVDSEDGQLVVTVEVYDHGVPQLSTMVNVTITVADVNDNMPVFLQQSYEFSVFESSDGSFVGNVMATDADRTEINSRISFQLERNTGSSNFLISSTRLGLGNYSGRLSLDPDVTVDYDTMQDKFFSLVVLAENTAANDAGNIANVSVLVNVLDVNDEPPTIPSSSQKSVSVSENGTQLGLVLTVVAFDPDTNHSLVFEELSVACYKGGSSAGEVCWDWFVLLPNGSLLADSLDIDYELCDEVQLTIRVEDLYTEKGDRYSKNETLEIWITDINDNAPIFFPVSGTFVIVPEISPVDLQVATVKATDADSGLAGTIIFSIISVVLVQEDGDKRPFDNLFKVVTSADQDIYTGSIQVASNLDSSLKGQYQVTVEARDSAAPQHATQTTLNIFTVDQSYRIHLQFTTTVDEVQSNLESIRIALTSATKAGVYVSAIRTYEDSRTTAVKAKSVIEAYFVYSNGTALDVNQLTLLINSNPTALANLMNLGLVVIGPGEVTESSKEKEMIGVIAGLAAFLVLFILIMILALVLTTRSYKRKLSAMKALKTATTLSPAVVQGEGIPGTNKYNAERANPMLNLSLDSSHDLGFHEETSSLASINSLDENMVNSPKEDNFKAKRGNPHPTDSTEDKVLAAALNMEEPSKMAYINTAFNTTDL